MLYKLSCLDKGCPQEIHGTDCRQKENILADESAKRSGGNKKLCSKFVQGLFKQIGRIKDEYSCVQSWQTGAQSGREAGLD